MLSDYEAIRLQNIERNNKFLENLGVSAVQEKLSGNKKKTFERSTVLKGKRSTPLTVETGTRKSRRIQQLELSMNSTSNPENDKNEEEDNTNERKTYFSVKVNVSDILLDEVIKSPSTSDPQTSSNKTANITYFIENLAKPIDTFGKAAVMRIANNGIIPRFNKYSGCVEWENCLFLWVNIGGKGGYSNVFTENGELMLWFGGSKMSPDSRLVKRLIKAGASDEEMSKSSKNNEEQINNENSKKDKILLFLRVEGENYSCLGRLNWVNVDLHIMPIQITWKLLDFDKFKNTDYFKRILKLGSKTK